MTGFPAYDSAASPTVYECACLAFDRMYCSYYGRVSVGYPDSWHFAGSSEKMSVLSRHAYCVEHGDPLQYAAYIGRSDAGWLLDGFDGFPDLLGLRMFAVKGGFALRRQSAIFGAAVPPGEYAQGDMLVLAGDKYIHLPLDFIQCGIVKNTYLHA